MADYGKREQTETEHLRQILIHLKFRKWQPLLDTPVIQEWLIEKGMVHDKERYLLDSLCQKLYQEIIIQLREKGFEVNEADLEHISSAPFEHINRLGNIHSIQI